MIITVLFYREKDKFFVNPHKIYLTERTLELLYNEH